MWKKLLRGEFKNHKGILAATTFFMTISAMMFALTILLFVDLLGAIGELMETAKTPDFIQMHSGDYDEREIEKFAFTQENVLDYQICQFLNLDNNKCILNGNSLVGNSQDNGLSVQGEKFDYLLDENDQIPTVNSGELYVPVCYKRQYNLKSGDQAELCGQTFTIKGFIRDSQMNSMMASSKRFLVCSKDYERMKPYGEEEQIIEFLAKEKSGAGEVQNAYTQARLPANGPAITKSLILLIDALSDGLMILLILFVALVVLGISFLCIRFMMLTRMEEDRKEVGMLKALGISRKDIRLLYFGKYYLLAIASSILGLILSNILKIPLQKQMKEIYGVSKHLGTAMAAGVCGVILTEGFVLFSIYRLLKQMDRMTTLQALFEASESKGRMGNNLLISVIVMFCVMLMVIPPNLYATISSEKFVTYMGIGDAQLRIDVRKSDQMEYESTKVREYLETVPWIEKYVQLETKSLLGRSQNGEYRQILIELGNQSVFPVSYFRGKVPQGENEIALSALLAKEVACDVGDCFYVMVDGKERELKVSGIYSDVTNGGKTAKACFTENSEDVMWSIFYLNCREEMKQNLAIQDLSEHFAKEGNSDIEINDIRECVKAIYKETMKQVKMASVVAFSIGGLVMLVVVMLFMRLITEKERYTISLQKAFGFSGKEIRSLYMKKSIFWSVSGIAGGILMGIYGGQTICGMMLQSMGADGFTFQTDYFITMFVIPVFTSLICYAAALSGTIGIRGMKAYECLRGRE